MRHRRWQDDVTFEDVHLFFLSCSVLVQNNLFSFANPLNVSIQLAFQLLLSPQFEKSLAIFNPFSLLSKLAGKNTQDEVEHEKGPQDDEWNEVNPVKTASKCIICLI